jgi:hypothetical protein
LRTLVESDEFTAQLSVLGNIAAIDEAVRGVLNGIATYAEAFDIVPGYQKLRIAKTDYFERDTGEVIPPLRIYFHIIDDDRVKLLWIERSDDDPGLLNEEV